MVESSVQKSIDHIGFSSDHANMTLIGSGKSKLLTFAEYTITWELPVSFIFANMNH